MKNGMLWLAVAMVAIGFMAVCDNVTGEPKTVSLTGTISVDKDDDDNITAVTLTVGDDTYRVVLDKIGKKLGEDMDGKKVEAKGVVTEKDDEKWLTVKSYTEVKEEEEDPGWDL